MEKAEYIDRDTFISKERQWYCDNCDRRKNSKGKTVYEIGEAPCRACDIGDVLDALEDYPAADVVEVVRCKDCIYFPSGDDNGENRGFSLEWPHDDWPEDNPCPCKCDDGWYSIKPTPEFYCAYGKRG